jgi:hypothetical protein
MLIFQGAWISMLHWGCLLSASSTLHTIFRTQSSLWLITYAFPKHLVSIGLCPSPSLLCLPQHGGGHDTYNVELGALPRWAYARAVWVAGFKSCACWLKSQLEIPLQRQRLRPGFNLPNFPSHAFTSSPMPDWQTMFTGPCCRYGGGWGHDPVGLWTPAVPPRGGGWIWAWCLPRSCPDLPAPHHQ